MTTTTSSPDIRTFYGKFRGTVVNNVDPLLRGRLLLEVPDVSGLVPSSWAEPCVPLAGPTGPPMGVHFVPPIGAVILVRLSVAVFGLMQLVPYRVSNGKVTADSLGLFGLVEIVMFIGTVGFAYIYVWRRGGLDWS